MKIYFVYILASLRRVLYVGVTNNLDRRLEEHRAGKVASFTLRYRVNRLVYVETTHDVRAAIEREKQIKSWSRDKKLAAVASFKPGFNDLSLEWRSV
jgi:putative endonuclease